MNNRKLQFIGKSFLWMIFFLSVSGTVMAQSYTISAYNGQTVTTCSGTFYDSGGAAGDYSNNENYLVTFCSGNGNSIRLDFSVFTVRDGDTLFIYDGPDKTSPLKGKYTDTTVPGLIVSSGTCLTFNFVSNNIWTRHGWVAAIACCPPTSTSPVLPSDPYQCAGSTISYSVDWHAGSTYNWTVINGTPASVTGSMNSLDVTWDPAGDITGYVKVVEINSCGSRDSSQVIVDIYSLPAVDFSGLSADYCVASAPSTLTGSPAGGIFTGPGITGNTFTPASAGAGTHNIIYTYTDPVTLCTNQKTIQTTVIVPQLFVVGSSSNSYCTGSGVTITLSGSETGVSYQLLKDAANDGSAVPGTGSSLNWLNRQAGVYTVVATDDLLSCFATMSGSQTITANPLPVPSFTSQPGPASCSSYSVTYTTQAGQSAYTWGFTGTAGVDYNILSGGTPADNSVTLAWLSAGSKTVSINYTDANGCSAAIPVVSSPTVVTLSPPAPTGASSQDFCSETSPSVVSLSATGSGILWYIAPAGGTALATSTPLNDNTHYYASQTVTGCESLSRLDVTVHLFSIPTPVTALPGSGATCSQITANWNPSAGAASYRLDVSADIAFASYVAGYQDLNTGNVTTINVTGLTAGSTYYYRVRAADICGVSANSGTITYATLPAAPATPGAITGTASQCAFLTGQIYSVALVPNATAYTWSVPAGWSVTAGQGTNSVTVSTGSVGQNGNITVTAGNTCGTSSPSTLAVIVNPNASITSVTGTSPLCIGGTSTYLANGVITGGGTGAWSSSNTAIATVNAAGVVTALSAGTCNIIYTITGGCGGVVSRQRSLTVTPNAAISSVTGTTPLCIGATATYTANGVVTGGGTGVWSSSNPAVATVNASGVVTGVAGGTCNIIYTITGGCGGIVSASQAVTVNPNAAVTSLTGISPMCVGTTALYTANGVVQGGGVITWSSSNPAVATVNGSGLVSAVGAGSCNIVFTITGGCGGTKSVQRALTVNPNAAVASISGTTPLCIGVTASFTANGVVLGGGTGVWSSSNPSVALVNASGVVTGVAPGLCTIIYTISGGCGGTASAQRIITILPNAAVGAVNGTSPLCIGVTSTYNVSSVIPGGGTGAWSSSNPAVATVSPAGVVTTVTAGTCDIIYTITGGCGGTVSSQKTLTVNANAAVASVTGTTPLCTGSSSVFTANGVVLGGGTGAWSSSNNAIATVSAAGLVSAVSAGTCNIIYTVTGGCGGVKSASRAVTVSAPPAATISYTGSPWCSTASDKTVNLTGTPGGTFSAAPAGLAINPATGTISPATSSPGTYTVSYTMSSPACGNIAATTTIIILPLPLLTIHDPVTSCSPLLADLTAPSVTAGSTAGLTLTYWSDALGTIPYSSPAAANTGTYYIKGTDMAGCFDIKQVNALVNPLPSVSGTNTDVRCAGGNDGSIEITVSGGTGAYDYVWTGTGVTQGAEDQAGLAAGLYQVTVTDAAGCSASPVQFTIAEPPALAGGVTDQSDVTIYGGNDGNVTIDATGGTPSYLYSLDGGIAQPSGTFSSLTAGIYTFTIQDNNLCTVDVQVTISEPSPPFAATVSSQTDVTCFSGANGTVSVSVEGGTAPYEYNIDGGTWQTIPVFLNLHAGDHTISIHDALLNTVELPVTILQPDEPVSAVPVVTGISCYGSSTGAIDLNVSGGTAPYSFIWSNDQTTEDVTGLAAGEYSVTISDAASCSLTLTVVVNQSEERLTGSITYQTDATCPGAEDGLVTVAGSGGTAPYEYSIDGGTFDIVATFSSLGAGTHSVSIRDAGLCTVDVPVMIGEPAPISITSTTTNATCPGDNNGTITVSVSGGTAPYTAHWENGATGLTQENLTNKTYTVLVTDINGCATSADIEVGVTGGQACLEIPTIITPNADGYNDTWVIKNIDLFPDSEISVYNRWGELVFHTRNLQADHWDGSSHFKMLPTDSYHYVLHLGNGKTLTGVISIIR